MNTLERLDSSLQKFIEVYQKLREEKEYLSGELVLLNAELEQAKETILNLRNELERFASGDAKYRDLQTRKDELREIIKSIINKIDRYSNRDAMGNVTNA